jgi:predicted MFS family arabinose efflux permease
VTRSPQAALWPLLLGNFVIGTGVMAPAGLIRELTAAFAVDVAAVGSLIAWGGALLCIEAPLVAFATSRLDRRVLLAGALLLFAAGHLASACAGTFHTLLAIRLVMIAAVACFTPQAASAVALFVPAERRAGAIAFIFLGWSLASALGLPLVNLLGSLAGWRAPFFLLSAVVLATLPAGLKPHPLSPGAWFRALASRRIWRLLVVSGLLVAGQNLQYPYIVVLLQARLAPDPPTTAALIAVFGLASICGTTLASRVVNRIGARNTANGFLLVVLTGMSLWLTAPASVALTVLALTVWGLGVSPSIAAQQARLVEANPAAASASVSLNTSIIYLGQASGALAGGHLLVRGQTTAAATLTLVLLALALGLSLVPRHRLRSGSAADGHFH